MGGINGVFEGKPLGSSDLFNSLGLGEGNLDSLGTFLPFVDKLGLFDFTSEGFSVGATLRIGVGVEIGYLVNGIAWDDTDGWFVGSSVVLLWCVGELELFVWGGMDIDCLSLGFGLIKSVSGLNDTWVGFLDLFLLGALVGIDDCSFDGKLVGFSVALNTGGAVKGCGFGLPALVGGAVGLFEGSGIEEIVG
jgi:hypothetical protein